MIKETDLVANKTYWFTYIYSNTNKNCVNFFSSIVRRVPTKVKLIYSKNSYTCNLQDVKTKEYCYYPKYWAFYLNSTSNQFVGQYLFETEEEALEFYNKSIDLEKEKVKILQEKKLNYLDKLYI